MYEQLYPHEPFGNYTTSGGAKKQAKYRYCMRKKHTTEPDDDFSSLYRVIDALGAPTDDLYVARVSALADIRSWAGYWVINRMCGNGDHYKSASYPHNIYTYIPPYGLSRLHANDLDGAFQTTYTLFPDAGYLPGILFAKPEFRRIYWRLALRYGARPHGSGHQRCSAQRLVPGLSGQWPYRRCADRDERLDLGPKERVLTGVGRG